MIELILLSHVGSSDYSWGSKSILMILDQDKECFGTPSRSKTWDLCLRLIPGGFCTLKTRPNLWMLNLSMYRVLLSLMHLLGQALSHQELLQMMLHLFHRQYAKTVVKGWSLTICHFDMYSFLGLSTRNLGPTPVLSSDCLPPLCEGSSFGRHI